MSTLRASLLLCAGLVAGCGGDDTVSPCRPACASGTHCDGTSRVPDALADMSSAVGADLAGTCSPARTRMNQIGAAGCEINISTDVANCGACGTVCKLEHATAGCSDTCFLSACDFGFDDCNGNPKDGCETTTLDDVKNCGGCGKACPLPFNATNL